MAAQLENVIQSYAWGSKTLLAGVRGLPPSVEPEAEIWMGAHPKACSILLPSGQSLLDAIQAAPESLLGADLYRRFGARLPFLLKLIAIERPLSLQAHPSAERAALGYERERALGIAEGRAERNYPDPYPKPELLVALSEVNVLVGFRPPADILRTLERLRAPLLLDGLRELQSDPTAHGLERLFKKLMTASRPMQRELVRQTLAACEVEMERAPDHREYARALALAAFYPDDVGAVISLLLNHLKLRPGQGVYLPARTLHVYLNGLGVEIMSASDNVLRGGLTPKHIDVAELLEVLSFDPSESTEVSARTLASTSTHREERYPTPTAEFSLTRIELLSSAIWKPQQQNGPEILLLIQGAVTIQGDGAPIALKPGDSAFISPNEPYELFGAGVVFRATAGDEVPAAAARG